MGDEERTGETLRVLDELARDSRLPATLLDGRTWQRYEKAMEFTEEMRGDLRKIPLDVLEQLRYVGFPLSPGAITLIHSRVELRAYAPTPRLMTEQYQIAHAGSGVRPFSGLPHGELVSAVLTAYRAKVA